MPTPLPTATRAGPTPVGTGVRQFTDATPQATPEQRYGSPVNPAHGTPGEVASPYPWERFPGEIHGPYGVENELLGDDYSLTELPAGNLSQDPTADCQPVTHAAPWPRGVPQSVYPDAQADRLAESYEIHSQNFGASRKKFIETPPVNDTWDTIEDVNTGDSLQAPVPGQIKASAGGWGNTDRVQSFARQNQYGFDAAHMHRRFATGQIPGNYMWMQPGSRPLVKTQAGITDQATDGPFAGQSGTLGYDAQGGILYGLPVAYAPGPDPATATAYPGDDGVLVGMGDF